MSSLQQALSRLDRSSSDDSLLGLAKGFVSEKGRNPRLIADLARRLTESGAALNPRDRPAGDVASTGGPGSLSTLLGPLYLLARGLEVPKLGIPGRPAGGIDCLAQIPGYRTRLSTAEVRTVLDKCGYAHFLPSDSIAPLDKRLFEIRQKNGLQSVAPLVVASLLSKKLAVGLRRFTIDVRVFPAGNFGGTRKEAEENASLMRETASELGLSAATVLSDCTYPLQPFIGRAEALWAMDEVISGRAEGHLAAHAVQCKAMAEACLPQACPPPQDAESFQDRFQRHLAAQGASLRAFKDVVRDAAAGHVHTVSARNAGHLGADSATLRRIMVTAQAADKATGVAEFPDPIGIRLLKRPGEWVDAGEITATVRASGATWANHKEALGTELGTMRSEPPRPNVEGVA